MIPLIVQQYVKTCDQVNSRVTLCPAMMRHDLEHVTFLCQDKNIRIKINPLQILLMGAVARLSAYIIYWYTWSNQLESSTNLMDQSESRMIPRWPIRCLEDCLLFVEPWIMNTRLLQALLNTIKQRIALQRFIFQLNSIQRAQTIKIVNLCDFLIPASLWIVWSMAIWKSCSGENMKFCPGQHPVTFKI